MLFPPAPAPVAPPFLASGFSRRPALAASGLLQTRRRRRRRRRAPGLAHLGFYVSALQGVGAAFELTALCFYGLVSSGLVSPCLDGPVGLGLVGLALEAS